MLMPVIALLLGGFLLDERLEASHFAGMAMIGFGLAAIDGRLFKMLFRGLAARTSEDTAKTAGGGDTKPDGLATGDGRY